MTTARTASEYLPALEENETATDYRGRCIIVRQVDYEDDGISVWMAWVETPVGEPLAYIGTYYRSENEAIQAGKAWIASHPKAKPVQD